MAQKAVILVALSMAVAISPAAAQAPPGNENTLYCLRVEPVTGSNIAGIACLTRAEWAEGHVDVDKVWAEDGVRVEG